MSKYHLAGEAGIGRIGDVKLTRAGELLVLDPDESIVSVFDTTGKLTTQLGGAGEGPHELTGPVAIAPAPDGGVFVIDGRGVVRLSRDGTQAMRWPLPANTVGIPLRIESHGQNVLIQRSILTRPDANDVAIPVELLNYSPGERLPGLPVPLWTFEGTESRLMARRMVLQPFPVWSPVGGGDLVAVGTSDKYELAVVDGNGTAVSTFGRNLQPRPITENFKRQARAKIEAAQPTVRDIELPPLEFAPTFPAIVGVFGGPNDSIVVVCGNLLDQGTAGQSETPVPIWDVFSLRGDYLGYVEAPPRFRVVAGVGGVVAGIVPDKLNELDDAIEVMEIKVDH